MKQYNSSHIVACGELNQHGTLFAVKTVSWFVEAALIAAVCEHGNSAEVVLRKINGMSFNTPVQYGDIVHLSSRVVYAGKTSLIVYVSAASDLTGEVAVDGFATFVTVDHETGKKKPHSITLDEPVDQEEIRQRAEAEAIAKAK